MYFLTIELNIGRHIELLNYYRKFLTNVSYDRWRTDHLLWWWATLKSSITLSEIKQLRKLKLPRKDYLLSSLWMFTLVIRSAHRLVGIHISFFSAASFIFPLS